MLLDIPVAHTHKRAYCKQKVFCCEMIHSALAINYFGQDDRLLGIIACCIDSQWKVPKSSYFSMISVITVLLLLCRALLLVSKHLMLGVVDRSPLPGKESSLSLQFPKVVVIFFSPGCTRTALLPECSRSSCTAPGEYPGRSNAAWLRFFSCCCLCCLGYQDISTAASPFLCLSKFCYYPLL